MDVNYWLKKWEKSDLGFHQNEVEPLLVKYFSKLTPATVLVPLCGKTKDMIWLANQGWNVIGVEASPLACGAFFGENALPFVKGKLGGAMVYSTERIRIYCTDFFALESGAFKDVTAIYDRAALIALPKEIRQKYIAQLVRALHGGNLKNVEGLLVSLEYPQDRIAGPPFSVESDEVLKLYGDVFEITEVERDEDTILPARNPKFNGARVFETAFWFQGK